MKKSFLHSSMILIAVLFLTGGCSKYDEGPIFSLYSKEKRVQGRWYFSRVLYNDVDSTDAYRLDPMQYIDYVINPERDENWAAFTWSHGAGSAVATPPYVNYGFWRLTEEKDSMLMVTTIKIEMNEPAVQDTVKYNWKVVRLAYTEMWLERMYNDTTKIEWKLWKRAY